jgi:hypothetical protein
MVSRVLTLYKLSRRSLAQRSLFLLSTLSLFINPGALLRAMAAWCAARQELRPLISRREGACSFDDQSSGENPSLNFLLHTLVHLCPDFESCNLRYNRDHRRL